MPLTLLGIFFGAAFTVGTAYALGVLLLRGTPAPPEIALGVGAAAESLLVFLLLVCGAGYWYVYLFAGALIVAAHWKWGRRVHVAGPWKSSLGKGWMVAAGIFGAYGLWYFVNALAPETLADGITYHLGLPYEYARLGGFPDRITFYDMVPQGMEMLYTMAFAFGRHSGAKLVEFIFFLATVPLMLRIGGRLQMSVSGSLAAAAIYFCAPVAGATGSSSYNDAAGVFFGLAAFYMLLVWHESSDFRYLMPAGVLAGFCFAIKVSGASAAFAALLFVMWPGTKKQPRARAAALLAMGAFAVIAPWLIRNAILTGNPMAPLLNSVFPNPFFHVATERVLTANLRSLGTTSWFSVPWELAFGGRLDGTFGPLLLAMPLGLAALRWRAGRWCWAAMVLLALPWFSDSGARFLMPAFALGALALAMVLPRAVLWAALIVQAVLCWPQAIGFWETRYGFRLHEFPVAAALRIEPEDSYLARHVDDFRLAKIIEAYTPPDTKILGLVAVANAYLARDVRVSWQSAESDRLFDTLRLAAVSKVPETLYNLQMSWPPLPLGRLRFRIPADADSEFEISDVRLYSGGELVYTSPHWNLRAWPDSWEAPLALDGNLATRWRTWEPARRGTYFEIRFDHPQRVSSATVYASAPWRGAPLEVYGQAGKGRWAPIKAEEAAGRVREDLRAEATLAIRRAGYRFVLVTTGFAGSAAIGNAIIGQEPEWGLERVAEAGPYYLLRVK